jgi:hypothetical protein
MGGMSLTPEGLRDMKVARLSALPTGSLLTPKEIPLALISSRGRVESRVSAAGKIKSVIPSGIEPATVQLIAMPQPDAPLRSPR